MTGRSVLTAVAGLMAATAVAANGCAAAASPDRDPRDNNERVRTSVLVGSGRMSYPVPDNDIRISVAAHAQVSGDRSALPVRSWGTVVITHAFPLPDGKQADNWGVLRVDCLTTTATSARVTGRLVAAGPYWREQLARHMRMGVSVALDADAARVGLAPATAPGHDFARCAAPAPEHAVLAGGYEIHDDV